MNLVELDRALRKLRLSGMADVLETRLRQAQSEQRFGAVICGQFQQVRHPAVGDVAVGVAGLGRAQTDPAHHRHRVGAQGGDECFETLDSAGAQQKHGGVPPEDRFVKYQLAFAKCQACCAPRYYSVLITNREAIIRGK